jgi:energy-coupling factor transport system substrate-specific component
MNENKFESGSAGGKLKAKDLITTAIFTVVFIIVVLACSFTFGMIPLGYPFLVSVIGLVGGTIWVYMRVKAPKRFTILIQTAVMTLVLAMFGTGWSLSLGFFTGGILAELITSAGKYKNFALNTAGFAAFCFCVHIGAFLVCLVARDQYYDFCVSGGMTTEWTETFLNFMSWPVMLGSGALAIVGAIAGMLIGRAMLKKHFVKAGMV